MIRRSLCFWYVIIPYATKPNKRPQFMLWSCLYYDWDSAVSNCEADLLFNDLTKLSNAGTCWATYHSDNCRAQTWHSGAHMHCVMQRRFHGRIRAQAVYVLYGNELRLMWLSIKSVKKIVCHSLAGVSSSSMHLITQHINAYVSL